MAWTFKSNWVASPSNPTYADLDHIGADLRTWGGNVDAGQNALTNASAVTVRKDETFSTGLSGGLQVIGLTDANKTLRLGVDIGDESLSPPTYCFGWIQAARNYSGYRGLALNPGGGNVGIGTGTVTPWSKFCIVGLPTSASGLAAGAVWNSGGVLHIV
jgi:hypothetical protein